MQAWMPSSASLMSKDPTWAVAALMFYYLLFPAIVRLVGPASRSTLVQILFCTWISTSVVPLAFVGFDIELGSVPHLVTVSTTFPLVHAASFVFGVVLGMLYLKTDRDTIPGSFAGIMATASLSLMLIFFLTTEIFDGRHLLWAYNGMFLPMMGFFFFFVAVGKDALLCPMFRIRAISENLGSLAMTVFLLQRFFIAVSG